MNPDPIRDTARIISLLKDAAKEGVIVGFSGGKDSLVSLDLVMRAGFKRVVGMYWYLVPGLEVAERWLRWAKSHYGIDIFQAPSRTAVNAIRRGVYTPVTNAAMGIKGGYSVDQAIGLVRHQSGLDWAVLGYKCADSLERRGFVKQSNGFDLKRRLAYPIGYWSNAQVADYLKLMKIPLPEFLTGSHGVALHPDSIFWLYDNHREDYERIRLVFPGVAALVAKRRFYPEVFMRKKPVRKQGGNAHGRAKGTERA